MSCLTIRYVQIYIENSFFREINSTKFFKNFFLQILHTFGAGQAVAAGGSGQTVAAGMGS